MLQNSSAETRRNVQMLATSVETQAGEDLRRSQGFLKWHSGAYTAPEAEKIG